MASYPVTFHGSMQIQRQGDPAPSDVKMFLAERGWYNNGDTWGNSRHAVGSGFTWEQAVAYEFMKFITLGGPSA